MPEYGAGHTIPINSFWFNSSIELITNFDLNSNFIRTSLLNKTDNKSDVHNQIENSVLFECDLVSKYALKWSN